MLMPYVLPLSLLFLAFSFFGFSQKPEVSFENVLIEKDFVNGGSKGFQVSGKCDIQAFKANYGSDSLMMRAFFNNAFYLTITPQDKDTFPIKPAMGYSVLFAEDKVTTKLKLKPGKTEVRAGKINFTWFVPYAALKLNATSQDINFFFQFYGKDGFNNVVSGKHRTQKINFVKPKTRVCEIQLDSVVVKDHDSKGQVWDANIYMIDKPDLQWSIWLGDKMINSIEKGSSYSINFGLKPRIFKFMISENDEIHVYLVDDDEYLDDPIANWKFNSTNMNDNISYKQEEAKANVTNFSFSCKVGPLK
jgi:hypothetical protein